MNANHEVTLIREMHINSNFGPGVCLSELISRSPILKIKMAKIFKRLYSVTLRYRGICVTYLISL